MAESKLSDEGAAMIDLDELEKLAEGFDAEAMVPAGFFTPTILRLIARLRTAERSLQFNENDPEDCEACGEIETDTCAYHKGFSSGVGFGMAEAHADSGQWEDQMHEEEC